MIAADDHRGPLEFRGSWVRLAGFCLYLDKTDETTGRRRVILWTCTGAPPHYPDCTFITWQCNDVLQVRRTRRISSESIWIEFEAPRAGILTSSIGFAATVATVGQPSDDVIFEPFEIPADRESIRFTASWDAVKRDALIREVGRAKKAVIKARRALARLESFIATFPLDPERN